MRVNCLFRRIISPRVASIGLGYAYYPGFPPGTVIFSLERAINVSLDTELTHPRMDGIIGFLFRCLRCGGPYFSRRLCAVARRAWLSWPVGLAGPWNIRPARRSEHNIQSHVASNAACTLTQISHTPGGMGRVVGHPDARLLGLALAEILNRPADDTRSLFVGIVCKLAATISEASRQL